MKRIMFIAFAFCALAATAMPTKEEQAEAQAIVNELMKDHIAANKKGKESNEAVGDAAMALAKDAQGEAAKFALFKGAVTYYARGKAYEKAADSVEAIMAEVSDVPPQTLNGIVQKAAANATEKKAPRLFALKKAIGRRAKAAASLKELEPKLKKSPSDPSLKRMHAELVAATGDWERALKEFAALGGAVGKIAEDEANGIAAEAAEFWWDYTPAATEAKDAIKEHASTLYRKALDYGELEGLKKNLAEKRIAEFKPVLASADAAKNAYLVVNLETNKQGKFDWWYESMSTQEASNQRYNTDEYKTRKMVFRRIHAGTYPVQRGNAKAIMDKDYYIGIFELTEGQYSRVIGSGNGNINSTKPLVRVSWNTIRGNASSAVKVSNEGSSFLAKLNSAVQTRTSDWPYIDLPTEAMWEVACRANCPATWEVYWGTDYTALDAQSRGANLYRSATNSIVGNALPNPWGLYDMLGNVWEYVLDSVPIGQPWDNGEGMARINFDSMSMTQVPANSGTYRMIRGTQGGDVANACYMSGRHTNRSPDTAYSCDGFRLAIICK